LSPFNFKIVNCPIEKNGKVDTQSRYVDRELEGVGENQGLTIGMFKPGHFQLGENEEAFLTCCVIVVKASQVEESSWSKEILERWLLVQYCLGIWNTWKRGQDYLSQQHYSIEDEIVSYVALIYISGSNTLKLQVAH